MTLGFPGLHQATRDHVVPRANGGKTSGNVVAACWSCNQEKGAMSFSEFSLTTKTGARTS